MQRLLKAGESLTKSQAEAAADKSPKTFPEARRDEQHAPDEARRDADQRAAELRAKTENADREGQSQWREMQADLNRHIERVRARMDAKKAAVDADVAEDDAEWAEADARDAIDVALSAIVEAEYATCHARQP